MIIQPVVRPLYASRSLHQFVDLLLGAGDTAPDSAVQETWRRTWGADFDFAAGPGTSLRFR